MKSSFLKVGLFLSGDTMLPFSTGYLLTCAEFLLQVHQQIFMLFIRNFTATKKKFCCQKDYTTALVLLLLYSTAVELVNIYGGKS